MSSETKHKLKALALVAFVACAVLGISYGVDAFILHNNRERQIYLLNPWAPGPDRTPVLTVEY